MAVVLVVDDEWAIADLIRDVLDDHGHLVHVANDGKTALSKALCVLPELIITDVMMPIMDGLTFLTELAKTVELLSVPVIVMSAIPNGVAAQARRHSNRTYFMQKPFRIADLVKLANTALATC